MRAPVSDRAFFLLALSVFAVAFLIILLLVQGVSIVRVRFGTLTFDENGNLLADMTRYAMVPREDADKYQVSIVTQDVADGAASDAPQMNEPIPEIDYGDKDYLLATFRIPLVEKEILAKAADGYDVRKANRIMSDEVKLYYLMGDWANTNAAIDRLREELASAAQVGRRVFYRSSDGIEISALVYTPDSPGPWPVIVFNSEGYGTAGTYDDVILQMRDIGYLVFAPSFRGTGCSGGRFEFARGEVDDVVFGLDYLETQGWIDGGRVAMYGRSHGATVAMLAAERDSRIRAVAEEAGLPQAATLFREDIDTSNPTVRYVQDSVREAVGGLPDKLPDEYAARSPVADAQSLNAPLLMIQGGADPLVPLDQVQALFGSLKGWGRQVELKVYADEPHGIQQPENRAEAWSLVLDWFGRYLR